MKTVALPAAIMAGVTSYAAAYHTLLHIRTGRRTRRDAQFGLLALGIGVYAMFSSQLYLSESVAEGAPWQRLQQVALSGLVTVFIYFVESYAALHRTGGQSTTWSASDQTASVDAPPRASEQG